MKKLEQERDYFVAKLAPEDQQEYHKKKEEFARKRGGSQDTYSHQEAKEKGK